MTSALQSTALGMSPTTPRPLVYRATTPLALASWLAAVVANAALPSQHLWAILGITAMFLAAQRRAILGAFLIAATMTVYGAGGEVAYLGTISIYDSTVAIALNFLLFGALGSFLFSGRAKHTYDPTPLGPAWTVLAFVSIALLLARFALGGVPLLLGNTARLEGNASLPAVLGLASGVLPIVLAFVPHEPSRLRSTLKIALAVLVFATASRLLIAAVLLGLLLQTPFFRRRRSIKRVIAAAIGLALIVVAVLRVYALRTDESIALNFGGRVSNLTGISGFVTELIGPSLFFAARNGLVIFETMRSSVINPPNGFILGGLANAVGLGADPERWMAQALGFDVRVAGAVATPIWSGATIDFGSVGAAILAFAVGAILSLWTRSMPFVVAWVAFAIVLSSYGSYLVSSQFLISSLGMLILALVARRRPLTRE